MRVLLFEHVSGGGMAGSVPPASLLAEGRAMLRAAAEDFADLGIEVVTTRDTRIDLDLPVEAIPVGDPVGLRAVFAEQAARADAALVIAPESDGVLRGWARWLEDMRVRSLGCSPPAVALCADKLMLPRLLARAGIATPPTRSGVRINSTEDHAAWRGPLVVKPRHGAGCGDTFVAETADALATLPGRGDWIVQPRVRGTPASVSLIVHAGEPRPLLAGVQRIEEAPTAGGLRRLAYAGGRLPLRDELGRRARGLAERAVRAIPRLQGFVGVDLVLHDDEPALDAVIEINPRLTTSYVGLRRLCTTSLAAAMLDPGAPIRWREAAITFDPEGHCTWEPTTAIAAALP